MTPPRALVEWVKIAIRMGEGVRFMRRLSVMLLVSGPHPISGDRAKSQMISRWRPSLIATVVPDVTSPISAAAMPRAWKRAKTSLI